MAIHDLTFTDWENYTDGDGNTHALDWTIPATIKGHSPYPYAEALRQALAERNAVVSTWVEGSRDEILNPSSVYPFSVGLPAVPLDDPVLGVQWIQQVLRSVMDFLWMGRNTGGMQWIDPSAIATMHNVEESYYDLIPTKCYTGVALADGWDPIIPHLDIRTNMLNDAGIVDTALRDWWLSFEVGSDIWGNYTSGYKMRPPLLFHFADIVWSMKRMLDLLTFGVENRSFPNPSNHYDVSYGQVFQKVGEATADKLPDGQGGFLDPTYPQFEAMWADSMADMDAAAWDELIPSERPRYGNSPVPQHFSIWVTLHHRYWADIMRTKCECYFRMFGDFSRNVEMSLRLGTRDGWNLSDYGRTLFNDQDHAGITGVANAPDIPNRQYTITEKRWVYSTFQPFTTQEEGLLPPITLGDYSAATIEWSETGTDGYRREFCGWTASAFVIMQDFDVTNGFIFR